MSLFLRLSLFSSQCGRGEGVGWLQWTVQVPIYHTYLTHYKEAECFRGVCKPQLLGFTQISSYGTAQGFASRPRTHRIHQPPRTKVRNPQEPPKNHRYETLFYQYGVDFVINGHAGVPMRGMVMSCSISFGDFPVH